MMEMEENGGHSWKHGLNLDEFLSEPGMKNKMLRVIFYSAVVQTETYNISSLAAGHYWL